ncbi:hypothetical protein NQ028_13550, partial [Corynebacterium phoceense]|nr:hypothetical protein [Corynebacterium phoceense]
VFIEGHSITFELFGVPRHGGRLPFFPTQPGWISGVHQTGVRSLAGIADLRILHDLDESLPNYSAADIAHALLRTKEAAEV